MEQKDENIKNELNKQTKTESIEKQKKIQKADTGLRRAYARLAVFIVFIAIIAVIIVVSINKDNNKNTVQMQYTGLEYNLLSTIVYVNIDSSTYQGDNYDINPTDFSIISNGIPVVASQFNEEKSTKQNISLLTIAVEFDLLKTEIDTPVVFYFRGKQILLNENTKIKL